MLRRLTLTLLVGILANACGGVTPTSSGPAPASAASGASTALTSTAPPTSAVPGMSPATPAPSAPSAGLPAGVDFQPAIALPPGFFGRSVSIGDQLVFLGATGTDVQAATLSSGNWSVETIGSAVGFAPPKGRRALLPNAFGVTAAASGSVGSVVAATMTFADGTGLGSPSRGTYETALWFSANGTTWQRIDPRAALGGTAVSLRIDSVLGTATGFLATGSVAKADNNGSSDTVVLRSTDGLSWQLAARLDDRWSTRGTALRTLGSDLLLAGIEYACLADMGTLAAMGNPGQQVRLWRSADNGASWSAVDLAPADPVLHTPKPAPADAKGCPVLGDMTALDAFKSTGSLLGVFDNRLVAISGDGGSVAVTADLANWTAAPLPGGAASPGPGGAFDPIRVDLLSADAGGWALRSLEPSRDSANVQSVGEEVRWWRSTDGGATWTAGGIGQPLAAGSSYRLALEPDGSVDLVVVGAAGATMQHSVAGQ